MAKKKEITIKLFVNGVQVETLTEEHKTQLSDRLGKQMSTYYATHTDEYNKIDLEE